MGSQGSGTIFFTHCNLYCIFCQNYEISHGGEGEEISVEDLAAMMLILQKRGCHNINFVTPSHQVYQILAALPAAIEGGLNVPLVYNSGGYDALETLRLLDGVVDIYMPDFKFWDPQVAKDLCQAEDYPEIARQAVKEMHRQVGDLVVDDVWGGPPRPVGAAPGAARRFGRHPGDHGIFGPGGFAPHLCQCHGPVPALRPGRGAPAPWANSSPARSTKKPNAWPGRRASPGWTGGKNCFAGCERMSMQGRDLCVARNIALQNLQMAILSPTLKGGHSLPI